MRPPTSHRTLAIAIALMAALSACKGRGNSVADAEAAQQEFPPGALMLYARGGGFSGGTTHVTVFADGRVDKGDGSEARVPVTRVEQLAAELAATGVFAQKDGAWVPSGPAADGIGSRIIVRDQVGAVHSYRSGSGATAPDAVNRAMKVGGAFVEELPRRPPCTCVAGDPLCSCF